MMKKKPYKRSPRSPIGKFCLCGKPAVKYVEGYVCARCLGIEEQMNDFLPKHLMDFNRTPQCSPDGSYLI